MICLQNGKNNENAVRDYQGYYAMFGDGCDLYLSSNCNKGKN